MDQISVTSLKRNNKINNSKEELLNNMKWFLVDRDDKRMLFRWPLFLRKKEWVLLEEKNYNKIIKTSLHRDVFPVDGYLYPSILIQ